MNKTAEEHTEIKYNFLNLNITKLYFALKKIMRDNAIGKLLLLMYKSSYVPDKKMTASF